MGVMPMNFKKLLVPFTAMSFMLAGCFGPDPSPVDNGWDANIKNTMQQEFGMLIPYVTGLDISSIDFYADTHVLKVSAYFDDLDQATSFVLPYCSKLDKANYDGGYFSITDGYYGCYSHTTNKTIVVSGETISELLWVEFTVYTYGDYGYTIDLIAYLSGVFATFPLDSLCELIGVSNDYKTYIPTFGTAEGTNFRIKGYVPGDIYYYVIAIDSSNDHAMFTQYTQSLTEAGFNVQSFPEDLKGTGAKQVEGLGTIEVHYYEVDNYFYGGFTLLD